MISQTVSRPHNRHDAEIQKALQAGREPEFKHEDLFDAERYSGQLPRTTSEQIQAVIAEIDGSEIQRILSQQDVTDAEEIRIEIHSGTETIVWEGAPYSAKLFAEDHEAQEFVGIDATGTLPHLKRLIALWELLAAAMPWRPHGKPRDGLGV
jgi:hypothetical protein